MHANTRAPTMTLHGMAPAIAELDGCRSEYASMVPDRPRDLLAAQKAAQDADDAWSTEGRRIFRSGWGDARYTVEGMGPPGSRLRELHDAYVEAREAWEVARKRAA